MAPKIKVQKSDIIAAALQIVRTQGHQALNARNLAAALGCSTQPIFSNFANMEELRLAVTEAAESLFQTFLDREIATGKHPAYKASGMAYIRFAREEKKLFQLLYMRDRTAEAIPEDTSLSRQMEGMVRENTGLEQTDSKLFHLEMWSFVHGIAAMLATDYLELPQALISQMLTDAYQGLRQRHEKEKL